VRILRHLGLLVLAAIGIGVVARALIHFANPDCRRPRVLVFDFDDLMGLDGLWQYPRFGADVADAIVRRGVLRKGQTATFARPSHVPGPLRRGEPGYDYYVFGSCLFPTTETLYVAVDITDCSGQLVRSLRYYLPRDPDETTDQVSTDVVEELAALRPAPWRPSLFHPRAAEGGAAIVRAAAAADRGDDVLVNSMLDLAARCWPKSPEPLRRRAMYEWQAKRYEAACASLLAAAARCPMCPRSAGGECDDRALDRAAALALPLAEESRSAGIAVAPALRLATFARAHFPNEGRAWSITGLLKARLGRIDALDDLETGVLTDYANGSSMDGSVRLVRSTLATGGGAADRVARLAAAGLEWRNHGEVQSPLRLRGMLRLNPEQMLDVTRKSDAGIVHFVAAHWLNLNKRPVEAAARMRLARLRIARLARNNDAVASLERTCRVAVGGGQWTTATSRPPWRACSHETLPWLRQLDVAVSSLVLNRGEGARTPDDEGREAALHAAYRAAFRADPLSRSAFAQIARRWEQSRHPDFDAAEREWKRAVAAAPRDADPLLGLGRCRLLRWDIDQSPSALKQAREAFRKAIDVTPLPDAVLDTAVSEFAERAARIRDAACLREVEGWSNLLLRNRGGDPRSRVLAGTLALQTGDFARATELLRAALRDSHSDAPEYAEAALRLVDVALRTGDHREAERWFNNTPAGAVTNTPGSIPFLSEDWRLRRGGPVLSVVATSRTVAAFQPGGRRPKLLWHYPTEGVVWCMSASDIDGDGSREILVGASCEGSVEGTLHVLRPDGSLKWRRKVAAALPNWADDNMAVRHIAVADFDGDGRREIAACATHHPWFPSVIVLFDPDGRLRFEMWHPGVIAAVGTLNGARGVELAFGGVNNHLEPGSGYATVAARLNLRGVALRGQRYQTEPARGRAWGLPLFVGDRIRYLKGETFPNDAWAELLTEDVVRGGLRFPSGNAFPHRPTAVRMALLIGSGHLRQGRDLHFTTKDATDLRDAYRSAGDASGAGWLCTGSLANRYSIRRAAEEMQQRWSYNPASVFNVHFSGHAVVVETPGTRGADVALALDGCESANDESRTLRLSEIPGLFGKAALGSSFFITIDGCLTSGLPGSSALPGWKGHPSGKDVEKARQAVREVERRIRGANVHILFACQPGDSAREVDKGTLKGGLFSRALADVLSSKRGRAWLDGILDSSEVTPLVYNRMQRLLQLHSLTFDQKPYPIGSGPAVSVASGTPPESPRR
jgi:tetratricopeptide (TPR) repeat protein